MIPSKRLLVLLLWLLASAGAALLLAGAVVGFDKLSQPPLDIQLHNTYFVLQPLLLVGVLWILMLLLIGFVLLLRSRRPLQLHVFLVAISALLIGVTTYLISPLVISGMGGWTIYPPLDAKELPSAPPVSPYQLVLNGVYALQFLAVATLSYCSYRIGKLAAPR